MFTAIWLLGPKKFLVVHSISYPVVERWEWKSNISYQLLPGLSIGVGCVITIGIPTSESKILLQLSIFFRAPGLCWAAPRLKKVSKANFGGTKARKRLKFCSTDRLPRKKIIIQSQKRTMKKNPSRLFPDSNESHEAQAMAGYFIW